MDDDVSGRDGSMSDPVEWLSNRLNEVEALARKTMRGGSPIDDEEESHWYVAGSGMVRNDTERITDLIHIHDAPHIALWDPASVLRLVAATRAVLELHYPNFRYVPMTKDRWIYLSGAEAVAMAARTAEVWKGDLECDVCGDENGGGENPRLPWPCPTLRAVAAGWGWVDE